EAVEGAVAGGAGRSISMKACYLLPVLGLAALAGCGGNESSTGQSGTSAAPATGAAQSGASAAATAGGKKWKIGFSQVTETEPWRAVFDKQLDEEAAKHPEVTVIKQLANDRTELQVQQMGNLITQQVNAILISPKESAGLTA